MHSETRVKYVKSSKNLSDWIFSNLDGLDLSKNCRTVFSVSCFDLAIEHHLAIIVLFESNINGSAFALMRLVFESFVRGAWLKHCATELQLDLYEKDDLKKLTFKDMVKAVEKSDLFSGIDTLSTLKAETWKAMNSYTHSGFLQVSRRSNQHYFEPAYTDDEIIEVLKMTGSLALLACQQIAHEVNNEKLALDIYEKMVTGLEGF